MKRKKALRKKLIAARKAMPYRQYQQKSRIICDIIKTLPELRKAHNIHIYYPINQEVDTRPLIDYLWANDKKVIMPRANFDTKEMANYFVINFGQLEQTKFGLMEPKETSPLQLGSPDLIIVPGVSFDPTCHRLGYGAGFYDKFLAQMNAPAIGVAFDLQISQTLPVEKHDHQLDMVVTESGIMRKADR